MLVCGLFANNVGSFAAIVGPMSRMFAANVGRRVPVFVGSLRMIVGRYNYLEHLVPLWWRTGAVGLAHRQLMREIVWPHFWATQLWLLVLLFVYCALRELIRVIGHEKIIAMFFGRRATQSH